MNMLYVIAKNKTNVLAHSHTSPIRQCDNDMLITVVRGHYREAGTVPDGAFKKILWGGKVMHLIFLQHTERKLSAPNTQQST